MNWLVSMHNDGVVSLSSRNANENGRSCEPQELLFEVVKLSLLNHELQHSQLCCCESALEEDFRASRYRDWELACYFEHFTKRSQLGALLWFLWRTAVK
jgi:hypothetical protein